MTDLAERFARTQGKNGRIDEKKDLIAIAEKDGAWHYHEGIGLWCLPIIWADCKAKGWTVDTLVLPNRSETRIWRDYFVDGIPLSFATTNDDPIAALCEAYCKAAESAR